MIRNDRIGVWALTPVHANPPHGRTGTPPPPASANPAPDRQPGMKTVITETEHTPTRPGWWCAMCGADWPCAPAKVELAEKYINDNAALKLYLAQRQWEAIDDATLSPDGIKIIKQMRERFLGWADALGYKGEPDA